MTEEDQREQWRYAVEHAPKGLLSGTDRETLAIWVCASVEYARAARAVRRTEKSVQRIKGRRVVGLAERMLRTHPAVAVATHDDLLPSAVVTICPSRPSPRETSPGGSRGHQGNRPSGGGRRHLLRALLLPQRPVGDVVEAEHRLMLGDQTNDLGQLLELLQRRRLVLSSD